MINLTALVRGGDAAARRIGFVGGLRFGGGAAPLLVWNVTARCNLACSHCYADAVVGSGGGRYELSTGEGEALLASAAEAGVPVVLFSGGEPLLRDDLPDLVRTCAEAGVVPAVSTNGTLLTRDLALALADAGCAYVGVSLDGDEATHDGLRGEPGSWRAALAGVAEARRAGMRTGIRFVLTRRTVDALPRVLRVAREEGAARFCLYHLVYTGRAGADEDVTAAQRRSAVESLLEEAARGEMEVLTVDGYWDGVLALLSLPRERREGARRLLERQGGCPAGAGILAVGPEGTVHPCQFWRSAALGNVRGRPLGQILSSGSGLLARLRQKTALLAGRCGSCVHRGICAGCRVRALARSGDEWAGDPACPLTDGEVATPL